MVFILESYQCVVCDMVCEEVYYFAEHLKTHTADEKKEALKKGIAN